MRSKVMRTYRAPSLTVKPKAVIRNIHVSEFLKAFEELEGMKINHEIMSLEEAYEQWGRFSRLCGGLPAILMTMYPVKEDGTVSDDWNQQHSAFLYGVSGKKSVGFKKMESIWAQYKYFIEYRFYAEHSEPVYYYADKQTLAQIFKNNKRTKELPDKDWPYEYIWRVVSAHEAELIVIENSKSDDLYFLDTEAGLEDYLRSLRGRKPGLYI